MKAALLQPLCLQASCSQKLQNEIPNSPEPTVTVTHAPSSGVVVPAYIKRVIDHGIVWAHNMVMSTHSTLCRDEGCTFTAMCLQADISPQIKSKFPKSSPAFGHSNTWPSSGGCSASLHQKQWLIIIVVMAHQAPMHAVIYHLEHTCRRWRLHSYSHCVCRLLASDQVETSEFKPASQQHMAIKFGVCSASLDM